MNESIKTVVEIIGTQKALAEACNVSQMTVSYWLKGGGISGKYIPLIAKASNGKVTETDILRSLTKSQ
ncbi:YdaS family helix-turn-helix protein [Haemophilus influenzae]|uniref:YdaS family helix-turn-helix protein n=1 Tax=Haemophilus influenzae TaxID=727 RepID=UPI002277A493